METALIDFTDSNGNTWEVFMSKGEMAYRLTAKNEEDPRSAKEVDAAGLSDADDSEAWAQLSYGRMVA